MNFFPFHIGDYAVHTRHLTLMEDLAYRRLLDLYYTREGSLPPDTQVIARLLGMKEHHAEVESVLCEFFLQNEDGWEHERCDAEIAKMQAKQENARASVAKRTGMTQAQRKRDASVIEASSTNTNTNTNTKKETLVAAERLPACPFDEIVALYHEHLPALPAVAVMTDGRRRAVAARWREVCSSEKFDRDKGLEWFAWFFSHASKSRFLTGRTGDWRADFDFFMTASKFAKVIEGSYHKDAA